jgi:hypothetical protein
VFYIAQWARPDGNVCQIKSEYGKVERATGFMRDLYATAGRIVTDWLPREVASHAKLAIPVAHASANLADALPCLLSRPVTCPNAQRNFRKRAMSKESLSAPDPTFATIAAFKAAGDAFDAAYDAEESALARHRAAAQLALDAASDTLKDARESLLNDPPTSFEGLAALLELATTEPDIAEWFVHGGDHVAAMRFFHTLGRSLCALAGLPEPRPPGGVVIPMRTKT